jgi:MFS family permease
MPTKSLRLRPSLAMVTILTAQLMLTMDFLIVLVALPRIQTDLGFSAAGLSWVPNAFALAFGGLLLLGGRLGDIHGQVRICWVAWQVRRCCSSSPVSFRA